MNDFTKKELEDLWSYIRVFLGNYKYPDNHTGYALMHKIQAMIDSYCEPCEHEFHRTQNEPPLAKTVFCGEELTYQHTTWSIAKCHKCGRVLNDNQ